MTLFPPLLLRCTSDLLTQGACGCLGTDKALWRASGENEGSERLKTLVQMVEVVAATALALAVLGIYGVVALAARRRKRELGIRMALGATKRLIIQSVLSSGFRAVAWGGGVGLPLAVAGASAVGAVLARTPIPIIVNDVLLYTAVVLLLISVGLTAMLVPATRASGMDPMKALRED